MEDDMECDAGVDKGKEASSEWSLWQLIDSILPTGGFAHSCGLESSVQLRLVTNPAQLEKYAVTVLENTGSLLLPFVHTSANCLNSEDWTDINDTLNATLSNGVARRASVSQGSALFRVASKVFAEELPEIVASIKDMQKNGVLPLHHASLFGLICGGGLGLGFDGLSVQRAFMFVTLRDLLSSATRLNLVGPLEAAAMQHRVCKTYCEEILKKYKDRGVEDACQTAPVLDTAQGCHDYLFTRLFRS